MFCNSEYRKLCLNCVVLYAGCGGCAQKLSMFETNGLTFFWCTISQTIKFRILRMAWIISEKFVQAIVWNNILFAVSFRSAHIKNNVTLIITAPQVWISNVQTRPPIQSALLGEIQTHTTADTKLAFFASIAAAAVALAVGLPPNLACILSCVCDALHHTRSPLCFTLLFRARIQKRFKVAHLMRNNIKPNWVI